MDKTDRDKMEKEARTQQKFSVESAIGRAGKGLLKGASPVSLQDQAIMQLEEWINLNILDPSGALKSMLRRRIRAAGRKNDVHPEQTVELLADLIKTILGSSYRLHEFVRQVDVRWGEMYQERPFFQMQGKAPHPDDEYTLESVTAELTRALEILQEK